MPQMLERVLADLEQRCNAQQDLPSLAVVRLSGLVHNEDRTAFQDIARQLCLCAPVLHAAASSCCLIGVRRCVGTVL